MSFERIWFIGDTHFRHSNLIKYCSRPFSSSEEMDEQLIKNWNKVVGREDRVFMLGDFALCGKDKIIEIGQQLKGRKILIMGNHDGASLTTYYNAGFEMASKFPILFKEFFILSHEPQNIQENGMYVNIFAHIHTNPSFKTASAQSYCVSAERINYTPIEFNEIYKAIEEERRKMYESR